MSSTRSLQSDNQIKVAGGTVYTDVALIEWADRAIWLSLKAFGKYWRAQRLFSQLAPFLGISSRRLRAFRFHETQYGPLTDQQAEAIIAGHITALRALAQHLREEAAIWDEVALREEARYRCLAMNTGESCHQPAKEQSASV